MKSLVVFCSIRSTDAFRQYAKNFKKFGHSPDVLIVDEEGEARERISEAFKNFHLEFYGRKERQMWLRENKLPVDLLPSRTTDVIGFSLLVAAKRSYDMIVFVDDDTYPYPKMDFLGYHYRSLYQREMPTIESATRWVNPIYKFYPRGYPYSLRHAKLDLVIDKTNVRYGSVLNMGLYDYVPDLNAMDYLYHGNLDGRAIVLGKVCTGDYIVKGYFPLSRMNIAFQPKIIPAFYQFTGNSHGVGRYGDVFSGLFIMKIAEHLGDNVSFGDPACIHKKEPRDVFRDMKIELEAIKLNEVMYKVLNRIEISGNNYSECYVSLAKGLVANKDEFHSPQYIDFLSKQMERWTEVVNA